MPRAARYKALFSLITMIVLTGCGQKGPLYLPQEPATTESATAEQTQNTPSDAPN